jgi:hypothetical protein
MWPIQLAFLLFIVCTILTIYSLRTFTENTTRNAWQMLRILLWERSDKQQRFQVLTAVFLRIQNSWDMTQCRMEETDTHFFVSPQRTPRTWNSMSSRRHFDDKCLQSTDKLAEPRLDTTPNQEGLNARLLSTAGPSLLPSHRNDRQCH